VHCSAPEWRVFVPLAGDANLPQPAVAGPAPALTTTLIRRGDRVVVEAGGEGFVVGLEAVAEADSRDGRVALRASGGGRRLIGLIGDDGAVRINGLNAVVNRR
jgi:flagella basal body P-ring formation protein FlgA